MADILRSETADVHDMKRPRRSSFPAFLLSMVAAVGSSVPAVQWCSVTWAEVGPQCFVECAQPLAACEAVDSGSCGGRLADEVACDFDAGEAGADSDAGSERGDAADSRAWCPQPAIAGVIHPVDDGSSQPNPVIAPADRHGLDEPSERWHGAPEPALARPPTAPDASPPSIRGPPLG